MNDSPALPPGSVALVGGGPGAADLITVRGQRLLQQADVVVADRLGPRELLAELPASVRVIEVGKEPGRPSPSQEEIGRLLIEQARSGARVVRLKGGDPYLLGRGGEEVLACRAAGVDVQVVPGVTSSIAGPAAGDVPVTHRGASVAVHIVNAHGDLGPADLAALTDPGTTTVLMMGVSWLPRICEQALLGGADPRTPVAVVQEATMPSQRVVRGTLASIAEVVAAEGIGSPAVITVGRTSAAGFLEAGDATAGDGSAGGPDADASDDAAPAAPALIACAHGTRSREGRDVVRSIMMRARSLLPGVALREAYVDVQSPELAEVVSDVAPLRESTRTRETDQPPAAVVAPLLLSTGFHVTGDVAASIEGHDAVAAAPLGPDPRLARVMAQRLREAGLREGDAVVMAAAGTRDADGTAMAESMGTLLSEELGRAVAVGHIAAASPTIAEAVASAGEEGDRVVVAPYLVAPGHFLDLLSRSDAQVLAAPLGDHPLVAEVLVDRYHAALGG